MPKTRQKLSQKNKITRKRKRSRLIALRAKLMNAIEAKQCEKIREAVRLHGEGKLLWPLVQKVIRKLYPVAKRIEVETKGMRSRRRRHIPEENWIGTL